MNKTELVAAISEKTELTKKDSEKAGEKKTSGKVKKPEGAKDAGTAAKKTQAIKTVKKKDDQA